MAIHIPIFFEEVFDFGHALFNIVAEIDMDMPNCSVFVLVNVYDRLPQIFHSEAIAGDCRDNRHADHLSEQFRVEMVAGAFQLVVHVQCNHHLAVHVDQLGGEI